MRHGQPHDKSPIWVVTSYYNPSKYRQRYKNFQVFRQCLNAPLLVVELARNGDFQLDESDANIVLQLVGEDRIWQKERLLNIGIEHLPDHVEYVAWVDCDVIFSNDDWPNLAVEHLQEQGGVLQLFEKAHHLSQNATQTATSVDQLLAGETVYTQIAFARSKEDSDAFFGTRASQPDTRITNGQPHKPKSNVAPGIAWAARRHEIQSYGLYDRSVIGGGDTIFVCAMHNWLEALLDAEHFGTFLSADALHWAKKARQHISPSLAALPTSLVHLWHGEFQNRHYRVRHQILARNQYNPSQDIQLAANGTWAWTNPSSVLAKDVADYFDGRREDG